MVGSVRPNATNASGRYRPCSRAKRVYTEDETKKQKEQIYEQKRKAEKKRTKRTGIKKKNNKQKQKNARGKNEGETLVRKGNEGRHVAFS